MSKDEQEEGAHYIRHVLLKRLLFHGPSHVLWAVTGAMAPVCISFGDVRCDGGSLLQHCRQLSLPSVYGLPHMQLIWRWQVCAHWVGNTITVNTISHPGRKATETPICTLNRAMCRTAYFWKLRNQQVRYLEINKWHSECNVPLSQLGKLQVKLPEELFVGSEPTPAFLTDMVIVYYNQGSPGNVPKFLRIHVSYKVDEVSKSQPFKL